nr:DUF5018 domain-containing protein [uncultured Carboxylicivirga sp.]
MKKTLSFKLPSNYIINTTYVLINKFLISLLKQNKLQLLLLLLILNSLTVFAQNLPINIDFSLDNGGMTLVQDDQTNYWMHGYLEAYDSNCMFITNDGTNNVYTKTTTSISHIYQTVNFNGIRFATLNFKWLAYGEYAFDYLRVYLIPDNVTIEAGTEIDNTYKLGTYNSVNSVQEISIPIVSEKITQDNMKLVFSWINDNSYGFDPPASINNISLVERTPNTDNDIISVNCIKQVSTAVIDNNNKTIQFEVYDGDITEIAPEFSLSNFAQISPESGTIQDFTNSVEYTVTAEDGTEQIWTVSITNITPNYQTLPINANFDTDNDGFVLINANQENYWMNGYLETYESNCMYITNNGSDNIYDGNTNTVSHLIKAINFNGIRKASISFDWLAYGASSFDNLKAYLIPDDGVISSGNQINDYYLLRTYNNVSELNHAIINLSSDYITQDNMKLVFSWSNDGISTNNPPASIDNVSIIERNLLNKNEIITASLDVTYNVSINTTESTVAFETYNADVTSLTPSFTLSDYASISPESGSVQDFSVPVEYTVTAEDGTTQIWTVSVNNILPQTLPINATFDTNNDDFITIQNEQTNYWIYGYLDVYGSNCMFITNNGVDNTYSYDVSAVSHLFRLINFDGIRLAKLNFDWLAYGEPGYDYLKVYLVPNEYELYAGSTISNNYLLGTYNQISNIDNASIELDESMITQDIMKLVFTWRNDRSVGGNPPASIKNVILRAINTENNITDFVFDEQVGSAVIDENNYTVDVSVASGTDLTSLVPSITISDYATVNPNTGVAQDFSLPFTYTVTAENGDTQNWTVNVSISTGIESSYNSKLIIYPNPFSEAFNVSLDLETSEDVKMEIYDIVGNSIWFKELSNVSTINEKVLLANSSKGIYLLKLTIDDKVIVKKVIRE